MPAMGIARVVVQLAALASPLLLLGLVACHRSDDEVCATPCKKEGRCKLEGDNCVSTLDGYCRASDICKSDGYCTAQDGKCIAGDDAGCEQSPLCQKWGRCKAANGICIAGSKEHCEKREECRGGYCDVRDGACVVVRTPGPGIGHGSGQGVGHCPCGCDHSQEMAAELATLPSGVARATIDETLHVIAEREDGGYITQAMVDHRRRMLALAGELGGEAPLGPGRGVPLSNGAPLGARAVSAHGGGLYARADLIVQGETTERIRGADKTIRASFLLALELDNQSHARRVLAPPKLEGDAGYPVSSWYLVGTDGEPWDGVLDAGESRRVNVIGYLERPLAPGSLAVAQVALADLSFKVESLAGAH
jgi:hypothetical protein